MTRWILAVAVLFGVAACVSKPTMELYGARVASASPVGVGVTMQLAVQNDNAFDLQLRAVRVNVTIADDYALPMIVHQPNLWLPAGAQTRLDVPVVIPWPLVGPLLAKTIGSDVVDYHVEGRADVTAVRALGVEVDDYEVDEDGSISRAQLLLAAGRGATGR